MSGAARLSLGAVRFLGELAEATEAGELVHVMRHPAGMLGANVSARIFRRMRREGLVEVGEFAPGKGRPLTITAAGLVALAAAPPLPLPGTPIDDPVRE
jgi:hypothetical protein